jgi:hypothetical protein
MVVTGCGVACNMPRKWLYREIQKMIIYLHQYRKTRIASSATSDLQDSDYVAAEVIAQVEAQFCYREIAELTPRLPPEEADVYAGGLLANVRVFASHV